jgi:hypothetical protein
VTILILEDDIALCNGIALALKQAGQRFVPCHTIAAAKERLQEESLTCFWWTSTCRMVRGLTSAFVFGKPDTPPPTGSCWRAKQTGGIGRIEHDRENHLR